MHAREQALIVRIAALTAVLALAAIVWTGQSGEGSRKTELYADVGGKRLDVIKSELKTYKHKLSSVMEEMDSIRSKRTQLSAEEKSLDSKAQLVRKEVHHTRHAITTLEYQAHDIRTEALSAGMFSSNLGEEHSSLAAKASSSTADHAKKADAKTRLASKAKKAAEGDEKKAEVVVVHLGAPVKAVAVIKSVPVPQPVAKAAVPNALQLAAVRAAKQQAAAVAEQQLAVRQRRELQAEKEREQQLALQRTRAVPVEQDRLGGVYGAQTRAAQAMKMAYMRSSEFIDSQEEARRSREKATNSGMPELPVMPALGPEAAAP